MGRKRRLCDLSGGVPATICGRVRVISGVYESWWGKKLPRPRKLADVCGFAEGGVFDAVFDPAALATGGAGAFVGESLKGVLDGAERETERLRGFFRGAARSGGDEPENLVTGRRVAARVGNHECAMCAKRKAPPLAPEFGYVFESAPDPMQENVHRSRMPTLGKTKPVHPKKELFVVQAFRTGKRQRRDRRLHPPRTLRMNVRMIRRQ